MNDNKKLFFGYQGGAKDRHLYQSYEEYKSTEPKTIRDISARYKPDYYPVVVEPKTMEKGAKFKSATNNGSI